MKHILVPYDGSEHADKAFLMALDFARKYQAKMTILSIARISEPPEDQETEAAIEEAREKYEVLFEKLRKKAGEDIQLNFEIKPGHAAQQIVLYAEKNNIDHIVIGHRGNTFLSRWLLGSVAKQVMIYAPCAITIVR